MLVISSTEGNRCYKELRNLVQDFEEAGQDLANMEDKEYPRFIFLTPEKLNKGESFRNQLMGLHKSGLVTRLVIDEAHCLSSWGHDFRKDYVTMQI